MHGLLLKSKKDVRVLIAGTNETMMQYRKGIINTADVSEGAKYLVSGKVQSTEKGEGPKIGRERKRTEK